MGGLELRHRGSQHRRLSLTRRTRQGLGVRFEEFFFLFWCFCFRSESEDSFCFLPCVEVIVSPGKGRNGGQKPPLRGRIFCGSLRPVKSNSRKAEEVCDAVRVTPTTDHAAPLRLAERRRAGFAKIVPADPTGAAPSCPRLHESGPSWTYAANHGLA